MATISSRLLLCFLLLFGIFSCQLEKDTKINKTYDLSFDTNKVESYKDIIHRIQKHDYPYDFRILNSSGVDEGIWPYVKNEENYLADSAAYHVVIDEFLNQDMEILHWLMSFKYDTIVNSNRYTPFFLPYHSPLNSNVPSCLTYNPRSPSRHAINYIFGYLSGGVGCVELQSFEQSNAISQYDEVEQFLVLSKNLTIEEKRKAWNFIQHQKILNRIFIFRFVGYLG